MQLSVFRKIHFQIYFVYPMFNCIMYVNISSAVASYSKWIPNNV